MATVYPSFENIQRQTVPPTAGELALLIALHETLDDSYSLYFNAYLDGDRPDIIVLKEHVGAFIIEVKDWDPRHYHISKENRWSVKDAVIKSPQAQVFKYKTNMYDLHLPLLGLSELKNNRFYALIDCYVYLHKGAREEVKALYEPPQAELRDEIAALNASVKQGQISHDVYQKRCHYLDGKRRQLTRDAAMLYTAEDLPRLIARIKAKPPAVLFTQPFFDEFHRRLSPPEHVLKQGIPIPLDSRQQTLATSAAEKMKIKGVAGSGKSAVLCQRAVNSLARHGERTLILTFNITLKNLLRDRLNAIDRTCRDRIDIATYHTFYTVQANNHSIELSQRLETIVKNEALSYAQEREALEKLYVTDIFADVAAQTERYSAIFIDEVQDYEPAWIKIVRDNFLAENGEMVLFGDQDQNIYQRTTTRRASSIVEGFGRWKYLKTCYRADNNYHLLKLFAQFQQDYLMKRDEASGLEDDRAERTIDTGSKIDDLSFNVLAFYPHQRIATCEQAFLLIKETIRRYRYNPNDVVVLCSDPTALIPLVALFEKEEKVVDIFESQEERQQFEQTRTTHSPTSQEFKQAKRQIEKIRRRKKNLYQHNSGVVRLMTPHSYKGYDASCVFYLTAKQDNAETAYTAMTRASDALFVLEYQPTDWSGFFAQHLESH